MAEYKSYFDNDTDYLMSVPGMVEKIKEGGNTPLSECVPMSEAWGEIPNK